MSEAVSLQGQAAAGDEVGAHTDAAAVSHIDEDLCEVKLTQKLWVRILLKHMDKDKGLACACMSPGQPA